MIVEEISRLFVQVGCSQVPPNILFDGKAHRVPIDSSDKKKSFSYKIEYENSGEDAYFVRLNNYRTGDYYSCVIRPEFASDVDIKALQKKLEEKSAQQKIEINIRQETAALEADKYFHRWPESGSNSYMIKKRISKLYGARMSNASIVLPIRDIEGKLWSYQLISERGKYFLKDSKTWECFHLIGEIKDKLYLAEGFATAVTIHECALSAVAVCLSATNMVEVAKVFRAKYPDLKIIVCSDTDKVGEKCGQKAATLVKGFFHPPPFGFVHPDYTDWNDYETHTSKDQTTMKLLEISNSQKYTSKQSWLESWIQEHQVKASYRGSLKIDGDPSTIGALQRKLYLAQDIEDRKIKMELISNFTDEWVSARKEEIFQAAIAKLFEKPSNEAEAIASIPAFIFAMTGKMEEKDVRVLQHFIWQVKRKMKKLSIEHHMMPIITGKSGAGKSVAIRKMLEPLDPLFVGSAMDTCSDERKWNLFSEFPVVYMDEMANMFKTDMNSLKNLITEDYLTFRPPYGRAPQTVRNMSTLIGTSNEAWSEIVRDPTSNRRFYALESREQMDWETINSLPYLDMWRGVDHLAEAPVKSILTEIRDVQEEHRMRSPAEEFLDEFNAQTCQSRATKNSTLQEAFQEFGKRSGYGTHRMSWRPVSILMKKRGFEQYKNNDYRGWRCLLSGLESFETKV